MGQWQIQFFFFTPNIHSFTKCRYKLFLHLHVKAWNKVFFNTILKIILEKQGNPTKMEELHKMEKFETDVHCTPTCNLHTSVFGQNIVATFDDKMINL